MTGRPPATALLPLCENVWEATTLLSFPGGVRLPARMTVVSERAKLLLHSPIAMSDELEQSLRELGDVAAIVAPNRYHHLYAKGALARFPEAKLYGVPGLPEKRKDLAFSGVLTGAPRELPEDFSGVLEPLALRGTPVLSEVALYHRPSASLITADMVFNIVTPANFSTKLALSTMGTRGRLAQSRFFHFYTRDKAAMRSSLREVLTLPMQRIVMGHGSVIEHENASELLREALWMMRGQ